MSQIANGAWSNPHDRLGSLTCQIDSSVSSGTSKSASVWTPEDPSPRRQNETLSLGTEMKSGTMFDELSRANAMGMVSSLPLPADSKLLSRPVDVGQPQANINLEQIQAQAELLEAQSRSDHQQALHLTEQHFRQMCDSKGIRVTHACEHCRQRKAKCSGQQPCQRCTKQGRLCTFTKLERQKKISTPLRDIINLAPPYSPMSPLDSYQQHYQQQYQYQQSHYQQHHHPQALMYRMQHGGGGLVARRKPTYHSSGTSTSPYGYPTRSLSLSAAGHVTSPSIGTHDGHIDAENAVSYSSTGLLSSTNPMNNGLRPRSMESSYSAPPLGGGNLLLPDGGSSGNGKVNSNGNVPGIDAGFEDGGGVGAHHGTGGGFGVGSGWGSGEPTSSSSSPSPWPINFQQQASLSGPASECYSIQASANSSAAHTPVHDPCTPATAPQLPVPASNSIPADSQRYSYF